MVKIALMLAWLPVHAQGCGLALLLAIDVSLSVDEREFALQTGGIAEALTDPSVMAVIGSVDGGVALSVAQWSGRDDQHLSLPWRLISNSADIETAAGDIAAIRRVFASKTAPGSALVRSRNIHRDNPYACNRRVTDVSGDGIENSGVNTRRAATALIAQGTTINGLVILGDDTRVEAFYRHNVIGGDGHFLEIASGFDDYGRAMRDKLLRELPTHLAQGMPQ